MVPYIYAMGDKAEQKREARRYLLGEMSHQEHKCFEDRYLADASLFEEVVAVEDEMIRSYIQGSCSGAERRMVEHRFLSTPGGRRKVELTEALIDYVAATHAPPPISGLPALDHDAERPRALRGRQEPITKWQSLVTRLRTGVRPARLLPAATLLTLFLTGSWLAVWNIRLRHDMGQLQTQQAEYLRREQQLDGQVKDLERRLLQQESIQGSGQDSLITQQHSSNPAILSFTLAPHLARHWDSQKPLVIPPGISTARLQLRLESNQHSRYSVLLETAEGNPIWSKTNLKSLPVSHGGLAIVLQLPSSILQNRNYVLKVSGITKDGTEEGVSDYVFRVVK